LVFCFGWPITRPAFLFMSERNPFGDLMAAGLNDLHGLSGKPTFVWLGITYPCVKSSLRTGTEIDFGGRLYAIKFSISVTTEAIKASPQPMIDGQVVTVAGVDYRVAVVTQPLGDATLRLDLISPNAQR
jgi:hypothetical protein